MAGDHIADRTVELTLDEREVKAPIVALHGMARRVFERDLSKVGEP